MTAQFVGSAKLPTEFGDYTIHGFEEIDSDKEHVVLTYGTVSAKSSVLCRIHSECLTGDCMFSLRCDCGPQLRMAMERIAKQGAGMIFYLRQEGRGIGLLNKIKAYELQDSGADTVEANVELGFEADAREYNICKNMLDHFEITSVKIMTNNPRKVNALKSMGINVTEVLRHHIELNPYNEKYLAVKVSKLGHKE